MSKLVEDVYYICPICDIDLSAHIMDKKDDYICLMCNTNLKIFRHELITSNFSIKSKMLVQNTLYRFLSYLISINEFGNFMRHVLRLHHGSENKDIYDTKMREEDKKIVDNLKGEFENHLRKENKLIEYLEELLEEQHKYNARH